MKLSLAILCSLALITFDVFTCSAKYLGTFGATYSIAEPDALKEIKERAEHINPSLLLKKSRIAEKVKNFKPDDVKKLKHIPPARKERVFFVDMTYTLDMDIADDKGTIVYPKGYTFNPLDYISYPKTIIIMNGNSPKQVAWFRTSEYAKDYRTVLTITDGSYQKLSKVFRRPVFYATAAIANVFQIKFVPSIIRQKGNMMEVTEISVADVKPGKAKGEKY